MRKTRGRVWKVWQKQSGKKPCSSQREPSKMDRMNLHSRIVWLRETNCGVEKKDPGKKTGREAVVP